MLRMFRGANKRTKTIWWVLTLVTVVTFLGGFVVIFGLGANAGLSGNSTSLGSVNGRPINQADYQVALNEQREQYRQRFGSEPADRDLKMVEMQAWRSVVTQQLMDELAKKENLRVHDREVVLTLQTSPPAAIANSPNFQTNGKFDVNKYQQALANPGNNWSAFEALIRSQLPTRKLEERLLASLKLSQAELLETYRDRTERLNATVVMVPPADVKVPTPTAADLDRTYKVYGGRFTSATRIQLEVLRVPRKFSEEDRRDAERLAQTLVDRARKGEDFAQLAKDYSEGPGAQQGGMINRAVQSAEFAEFGQHLDALPIGGISDPIPATGRFLIIKVLNRFPDPMSPTPSMQVAQIVVKVHGSDNLMREQLDELKAVRGRASRIGLGKAAAEKGWATLKTRAFDLSNTPEELYSTPEAADWGLVSKTGAVSPVFAGLDEFVVAQVAERHESGPPTKDELGDALRQLAQLDAKVDAAKPRAEQVAAAVARGGTLEAAAKAAGLEAAAVQNVTRAQPDPRIATAPELVGALFGSPVGRVIGPIRSSNGWYLARVDERVAAPDSVFEKIKGQVTSEILQRKQQTFFAGFVGKARDKAKIKDLRGGTP